MIDATLKKRFRGQPGSAAFDLDLNLTAGDGITALFGPSGAGKTLTLDLIAGFVSPDEGHLELDREVLYDHATRVNLPARARRTGYVFQNYALFPHLTLRENLQFAARQRPGGPAIDSLLDRFRLSDVAARRPHQLSGGQQQRGSIARALVGQPRLLLLDEPTRGLDAPLRQEFYSLLSEIRTPVLLVTHDLDECHSLATRMVVMRAGRIEQSGAPHEVTALPANAEVARLLGIYNVLPTGCIQHRHVRARPLAGPLLAGETAAQLEHLYQRPHHVIAAFTGGILVEMPRLDSPAKNWALSFPPEHWRAFD